MKTQNIIVDGRPYVAAVLTKEQVAKIEAVDDIDVHSYLEESTDRESWADQGTEIPDGVDIVDITGHGEFPLDIIASAIHDAGVDWDTIEALSDCGFDTDIDGVGLNSVYAIVPEV